MKKANFLLKNCKNYEDLCKWAAGSFLPEPRPFEFTGQTAPGEPSFRQAPEPMPPIELQEWMNENRPAVQEPIVSPGGLFPEVTKEIAIKKEFFSNDNPKLDMLELTGSGTIKEIPAEWTDPTTGKLKTEPGIPTLSEIQTRARELVTKRNFEIKQQQEIRKNQAKLTEQVNFAIKNPILSRIPKSAWAGATVIIAVAIIKNIFSDSKKEPVSLQIQDTPEPNIFHHIQDKAKEESAKLKAALPSPSKLKQDISTLNSSLSKMQQQLNSEDQSIISRYVSENSYLSTLLEEARIKSVALDKTDEVQVAYNFYFDRLLKKLIEHKSKLDALYTRLNMLQNNKTFTVDNDTINETAINCERIVDDLAIYIDTMHKIQQG